MNNSFLASTADIIPNSLIPRVLIVDDEPAIRTVLKTFYEGSGYTAVEAASGEEAVEHLAQCNIDFVITDLKLPVMSGSDLVAKMKDHFPDVPVMLMTGCSEIDIAIQCA